MNSIVIDKRQGYRIQSVRGFLASVVTGWPVCRLAESIWQTGSVLTNSDRRQSSVRSALVGSRKRKPKLDSARSNASVAPLPRYRWYGLLLIVCGGIAYANSFNGVFLLDDDRRIVNNESIRSLSPIGDVLSHGRRPLVNLSLAVNYHFGQLDVWGYHAVNVTVHLISALTLFALVSRTLARDCFADSIRLARHRLALLIALLWVVHPLNTQAVTYIIQRGESMMGMFYLVTLYCAARALDAQRGGGLWSALSVMACGAGMACKAVMVTAPVLVVLHDLFFAGLSVKQLLRRRAPLYAGLCATWMILVLLGVVGSTLGSTEQAGSMVGFSFKGISWLTYALTQPWAIVQYLRLTVWPSTLCFDYGWPEAHGWWMIAGPSLVLVSLLLAVFLCARSRRWLWFPVLWFFAVLAPTSSVIPIRDTVFEHRMYLPLVAPICLLVGAACSLMRLLQQRGHVSPKAASRIGVLTLVVVVGALMIRTMVRNRDYSDAMTMWQDAVAKRPHNPRAHSWMGVLRLENGDLAGAKSRFLRAIEIDPSFTEARINLAAALVQSGKVREGISAWREVVAADPTYPPAHMALGDAYSQVGDLDQAAASYEAGLQLTPQDARALYNYGNALKRIGRNEDAAEAYRRSIAQADQNASSHNNLGSTLMELGDFRAAAASFRRAVQLNPGHLNARYQLGRALGALNEHDRAAAEFRALLAIQPRNVRAMYGLGRAMTALGRYDEAVDVLSAARDLAPGNAMIQSALQTAEEALAAPR